MRKLICLLLLTVAITACGKKGPLIYPDMLLPAAPADLSLQQTGTSIRLSCTIPSKDQAGRTIGGLTALKILKRDEANGQFPVCNSCTTDFSLFRTLNLEPLPAGTQRLGSLLLLLDGDVQPGRTYTYRVAAISRDGQEGALSAPVATSMVTAPLPPVVQVHSQPTEIQLEIVGVPPREGALLGFNVYRSLKGEPFPYLPLNREPLTGSRYADVGLERATSYVYAVRTVVRLPSGARVESAVSNEVVGVLKDDE